MPTQIETKASPLLSFLLANESVFGCRGEILLGVVHSSHNVRTVSQPRKLWPGNLGLQPGNLTFWTFGNTSPLNVRRFPCEPGKVVPTRACQKVGFWIIMSTPVSGNAALWLIWLLKAPQSEVPSKTSLVSSREDTRYLLHPTAKAQTLTWCTLKSNISLFGSHIPGIIIFHCITIQWDMILDEMIWDKLSRNNTIRDTTAWYNAVRYMVQYYTIRYTTKSASAWPAFYSFNSNRIRTVLVPACKIIQLHTVLCREGVVVFLPETKRRDLLLPFSHHPSVEQTVHMSTPPCWYSKRDVATACECVVPVRHHSSFGLADSKVAVWEGPLDDWRRSTGCRAAEHDLFQAPVSPAGSSVICFHLRYSFIGG